MKKRFLSAALSCILIFTMTASTAFAEVPDTTENPVDPIEAIIDDAAEDPVQGEMEDADQGETEALIQEQEEAPAEAEQELVEENEETSDPANMVVYDVTFNFNGGANGPDDFSAEEGYKMTFPDEVPYRYGYNFLGWRTNSTYEGHYYQPGDVFYIYKNVEFKACWSDPSALPVSYTDTATPIHLYKGQRYYYYGSYATDSALYCYTTGNADTYITIYNDNQSRVAYNDDGGENHNALLKCPFDADKNYMIEVRLYSNTAQADINICHQKGYMVKLYENGADQGPYKYMTFGTESLDFESVVEATDEAKITYNEYYHANGGTFTDYAIQQSTGSTTSTFITGGELEPYCWNTKADGSGTEYQLSDISKKSVTLYPRYAYEIPAGLGEYASDEYGKHLMISRSGYAFEGWYTAASGGTKLNSNSNNYEFLGYGDFTRDYYAHWKSPLRIIYDPDNAYCADGKTTWFEVEAEGTGLTYQWQYSKDKGTTWINSGASSAKSAILKFTATASKDGYLYRCIVKDSADNTVVSDSGRLHVFYISKQPATKTFAEKTSVTFTVASNVSPVAYQWQYSKDNGKTWVNSGASSANTATLKFTATSDKNGWQYRCLVEDEAGLILTSKAATLKVFYITKQPATQTFASGTSASFTVAANGTGMTYQWQYSKDNGTTWVNSGAASATTATLQFSATGSKNGYKYRCIVKDSSGKSITSNAATLKVFYITKQPVSVTAKAKTSVTFTVAANGSGMTYQWQYSKDKGTTWINSGASSAKTDTLKFTATSDKNGWKYRCIVKDSAGRSVTSSAVTLTVK